MTGSGRGAAADSFAYFAFKVRSSLLELFSAREKRGKLISGDSHHMRSETLAMWKRFFENSMSECAIINNSFEVLWSRSEIIFGNIPEDDLTVYSKSGTPCGFPLDSECYAVLKTDEKLVPLTVSPVYEEEDKPCGYVLKLIEPFELFGGRLTPKRNVSEVRRYTSGIIANVTALRTTLEEREMYKECEFIKGAISNCYKLLAGASNSVQLNRFFSGSDKKVCTDLSKQLTMIVDICRFKLEGELEIVTDIDPEIIIDTDLDKFASAVVNLIINSYQYNNSDKKHIAITFKKSESTAVLTVDDNGIGISRENAEKIFSGEMASNEFDGVSEGLGLAVVRLYADELGAEFKVLSKGSDGGTTVQLIFPCGEENAGRFGASRANYAENRFSSLYTTLAKATNIE